MFDSKLSFSSQAILCDVPRLQYIIVVDIKPTSWSDMPRGITVYNMEGVKELGSKPVHSECLVLIEMFLVYPGHWSTQMQA